MSTLGRLLRISTFGESHGKSVGVIIDGVPPNMALSTEDIQRQLDRRKPGQSYLTTSRMESDYAEILSGLHEGKTLGTPIMIKVDNFDARPMDYETETIPRPSHADYSYLCKYSIAARSGGGRASARETIGRVAAGAVAEKWLSFLGIRIVAFVSSVGKISMALTPSDFATLSRKEIDESLVRCPDRAVSALMVAVY